MVAKIEEPQKFDECCRRKESNCSNRFISEFHKGKGAIYVAVDRFTGVDGLNKLKKALNLNLEAKHQHVWAESTKFESPVYFTMSVSKTGLRDLELDPKKCWSYMNKPPQGGEDKGGQFFVAPSGKFKKGDTYIGTNGDELEIKQPEKHARKDALCEATISILQYAGRGIQRDPKTDTRLNAKIDEILEDDTFIRRAVTGYIQNINPEMYCETKTQMTTEGPQYQTGTVIFMSYRDLKKFQREVLGKELKALIPTDK